MHNYPIDLKGKSIEAVRKVIANSHLIPYPYQIIKENNSYFIELNCSIFAFNQEGEMLSKEESLKLKRLYRTYLAGFSTTILPEIQRLVGGG